MLKTMQEIETITPSETVRAGVERHDAPVTTRPDPYRPDPYRMGELAARAGRALSDCPFGVNDENRVDWMLGYHQAQEPHDATDQKIQTPGNPVCPNIPVPEDRP